MRKSKFGEEQIISILAEQERGMATSEVCRRHGVSSVTFYKWKARFGGMDVSDARRLKTLETENARLKQLFTGLESNRNELLQTQSPHPTRTMDYQGRLVDRHRKDRLKNNQARQPKRFQTHRILFGIIVKTH